MHGAGLRRQCLESFGCQNFGPKRSLNIFAMPSAQGLHHEDGLPNHVLSGAQGPSSGRQRSLQKGQSARTAEAVSTCKWTFVLHGRLFLSVNSVFLPCALCKLFNTKCTRPERLGTVFSQEEYARPERRGAPVAMREVFLRATGGMAAPQAGSGGRPGRLQLPPDRRRYGLGISNASDVPASATFSPRKSF